MRTRNLFACIAAFATFAVVLGDAPAAAQTPRYWVMASAQIQGMPTSDYQTVGPLAGETLATARVAAGPLVWESYGKLVSGSAYGGAVAEVGVLAAEIGGSAGPREATQFPTYGPGSWALAQFVDSVVVESSLPAGTQVTLTFRVAASSTGTSTNNGVASSACTLAVGGVAASSYWSFRSTGTQTPQAPTPAISFNTRVGNRMRIEGKLTVNGSAPWFMQGSTARGGQVDAGSHCELILEEASGPVWLVADSGHDYGTPVF